MRTGSRGRRHSPGTQHPRASSASRSPVAPCRRGAIPRSTCQRNRTYRAEVVERVTQNTCLPERARPTNNREWTKAKFQERSASPRRRRRATRRHAGLTLRRGGARGCSEGRADAADTPAVGRKCLANFHFRAVAGAGAEAGEPAGPPPPAARGPVPRPPRTLSSCWHSPWLQLQCCQYYLLIFRDSCGDKLT